MADLHYASLCDLSDQLRAGALSPLEATRALLARIDALDPSLHAFVTPTPERALERAAQAEREIGAGDWRGPLHGVPIAIKDLCHWRGVRNTAGTRVLRDFVGPTQFCIVTHHKRTMAECQKLYGITMAKRGVSTRISVSLDEVDSFAGNGSGNGNGNGARHGPHSVDPESPRIAGEEQVGF